MTIATINASEDQSQYIGDVYQEHGARLRHYFLVQLGDAAEAEDCVQETICRLFFFMEDRNWEAEAEYISVYLMRIAGLLCSRKLSEKSSRRTSSLNKGGKKSLFNKVRTELTETIKHPRELIQFVLTS
jgi:DNA-directed RNA polymerase specialized sigma24 family protein